MHGAKRRFGTLMYAILAATMAVMVTFVWILTYTASESLRADAYRTYTETTHQIKALFETNLEKFELMATTLAANNSILTLSQMPDFRVGDVWDYNDIINQLNVYSCSNDVSGVISVYFPKRGICLSSAKRLSYLRSDDAVVALYAQNRRGGWILWDKAGRETLTCLVGGARNENASLFVTVDVDAGDLADMLDSFDLGGGAALYTASGAGIYSRNEVNLLKDEAVTGYIADGYGTFKIHLGKDVYHCFYAHINDGGFAFATCVSEREMLENIRSVKAILYWITALCGVSYLVIIKIFLRRYLAPLKSMSDALNQIGVGNLKYRVNAEQYHHEYYDMFANFNAMALRMDRLINEDLRKQVQLDKMKLKLLQSQINPHFLNNCLNFIYQSAMCDDYESAADMAKYLGRFFRFTMRVDIEDASVEEELDNIRAYVGVQKLRFPGGIEMSEDVEEGLGQVRIPRLLIQPLVENAINHGYIVGRRLHISISARRRGDRLMLTVADDGSGMDAEQAKALNASICGQMDADAKGSFALRNIYWRLNMKYPGEASVTITPCGPMGLEVTLSFPLQDSGRRGIGV